MPFGVAETTRVINRAPSPVVARALPWLVIMAGSVAQGLPIIASAPVMPPLGFLMLMAWRQLRPGLLPVWAGLPLGLFDDLYSGQPMGSGMLLWSAAMIGMDLIEMRFPWRSYVLEWAVGAAFILGYLLLAGGIAHIGANTSGGGPLLAALVPQLIFSVLLFPLIERFVALCDKARLWRFRAVS